MSRVKIVILMASVLAAMFFSIEPANAKTILITDVDDTLKVSHVLDLADAAAYLTDTNSRFLGLSETLTNIRSHVPDLEIIYLSKGPDYLVSEVHKEFLKNGHFPQGQYIARTDLAPEVHKLLTIRKILKEKKPDKVIFLGDNGEQDSEVYHQITIENKKSPIRFITFIHTVYSKNSQVETGSKLYPEQVNFVSSIELSIELTKNNFVSLENTQELIRVMGPIMAAEKDGKAYDEMVFPYFMNCDDFKWNWNEQLNQYKGLKPVLTKLKNKCHF